VPPDVARINWGGDVGKGLTTGVYTFNGYQYQLRLLLQRDEQRCVSSYDDGNLQSRARVEEHLLAGRWGCREWVQAPTWWAFFGLYGRYITGSSLNDRILAQTACALRWRRYLPLKIEWIVQDEDEHEIVKRLSEGSEYQN
jgi:hypothetical protein